MSNNNIMHYKGYHAKAEYSVDDQLFYGRVLGLTDLVDFYAENAKDVEKEFHTSVDEYLAFCAEIGKEPQKEYSGTFNIRIPPELHKQAALKAEMEGVSLNKITERALAQYCIESDTPSILISSDMLNYVSAFTQTAATDHQNSTTTIYANRAYIGGSRKC